MPADPAYVTTNGQFELRNVQEGEYLVEVLQVHSRDLVYREIRHIHSHDGRISIRLPSKGRARPGSGVVSVRQLMHKPPKDARKAFQKSIDLIGKNDMQGSIAQLQKALEIDPEYVQAYNNLGVRYMMQGSIKEAVGCFRRGIEIDPDAASLHTNLAHALIINSAAAEAEPEARRAVSLNPEDAKSAYLLGLSLIMQDKFTGEAIASLRRSDHISPRARLTLGLALARTGAIADARSALSSCLETQDAPVRAEAQRILSKLN